MFSGLGTLSCRAAKKKSCNLVCVGNRSSGVSLRDVSSYPITVTNSIIIGAV